MADLNHILIHNITWWADRVESGEGMEILTLIDSFDNVKIAEHADGCRVNIDELTTENLLSIMLLIEKSKKRWSATGSDMTEKAQTAEEMFQACERSLRQTAPPVVKKQRRKPRLSP